MDREVTLTDMLDARESRALRQRELLAETGLPLVSFTLNIAGPVKNSPLLRRAFREGLCRLEDALAARRMSLRRRELVDRHTGCEALLAVEAPPEAVKQICVRLEDADALGRLFDMDVLSPAGDKLDRAELGFPPRPCLICGGDGRACASRRLHPVPELQAKTAAVLREAFARQDAELLAAQAVRALLYEVCASPKPGLVDRFNCGSHRDMDIFTFVDSASALLPYLRQAAALGMETAQLPRREAFLRLREEGLAAERAMLAVTGGVNAHKGAVFSLGTVLAAAGRLWQPDGPWAAPEAVLRESGLLYSAVAEEDFQALEKTAPRTAGQRFYQESGLRGVRGELAKGLPSVEKLGLPAMERALAAGAGLEEAGLAALAALMANVADTNLLARGGQEGAQWAAQAAGRLSVPIPGREELEALDREMTARRLSPGGCADLLAICYFLHFMKDANI